MSLWTRAARGRVAHGHVTGGRGPRLAEARVAFPPDLLFLARLFPPPPSDGFRDGRLAGRLRIVPDVAMFSFDLRSFRSSSYKPLHFYTDC